MVYLETYNGSYNKFINNLQEELSWYGCSLKISIHAYVKTKSDKCNGYFDDNKRELAIAVGKPIEQWFPTLLHESSHFDQWKEQCYYWVEYAKIGNDNEMDDILSGKVKLSKKEIVNYFSKARDLELDCERRTLKKIKFWKFKDIDPELYAQKASAYVYFYNYIAKYKKWYKIGKEPYNDPYIIKEMPDNLCGDYTKLDKKLIKLFDWCCE